VKQERNEEEVHNMLLKLEESAMLKNQCTSVGDNPINLMRLSIDCACIRRCILGKIFHKCLKMLGVGIYHLHLSYKVHIVHLLQAFGEFLVVLIVVLPMMRMGVALLVKWRRSIIQFQEKWNHLKKMEGKRPCILVS